MRFVPLSEAETTAEQQQQAQPKQLRFVPLDTAEPAPATKAKFVPVSEAVTPDDIRKQAQEDRNRYREKTGLAPSTTAPVEGTGGAAFGVFAVQGKQRRENIEARKAMEAPKLTVDQLSGDNLFPIVQSYMKAAGEKPFDEGKETRKDFVERFYSSNRFSDFNTVLGTIPRLAALRNSTKDTKEALAMGMDLYQRAASAGEAGGPSQWNAVKDIVFSVATDAATYMGFGVGKGTATVVTRGGVKAAQAAALKTAQETGAMTTKAALPQATKEAIEQRAKRAEIASSAATESVVAGVADTLTQKAEQEQARIMGDEVPEYNAARTLFVSVLGGTLSAAASAKGKAPTIRDPGELTSEQIEKNLKKRSVTTTEPGAPLTEAEQKISSALVNDFDTVHSEYVKSYGKQLLQEIDPATTVTDSKVQEAYSRSAVRMALNLMKDNPNQFGWNPAKEQISDAIYRTFSQLETGEIADTALESAIRKAGLTPDQFAAMTKTTASEAGKVLQAYSVAARATKRLREIDPEFNKRMEELYGVDTDNVRALTRVGDAVRRVERESKAIVTSGIDTLARNLIGNFVTAPLSVGVRAVEGLRYSVGTALDAASGERFVTFKKLMGDTLKDSVGMYEYLKKSGLAEEVTEKLLENNPSLLRQISSAVQETDMGELSPLARWSQSLNGALDGLQRRAYFVASVESQLRRVGLDLYTDVLAKNKEVPTTILKAALDESFTATFSYTPKAFAKSYSMIEEGAERVGAGFVKFAEKPGMSVVIPFPRFVANAFAFQYKYSPLGFAGATEYMAAARRLRKEGRLEEAERVGRQGAERAMQATVGVGMLAAAYDYRANNPDTPWYIFNGVDVRSIFPIAPYLGIADWMRRDLFGGSGSAPVKEIVENIMGFKLPAGTQHTILTTISDVVGSEERLQKLGEGVAKLFGDFGGRFTQPFITKQIFDTIDMIRGDEALKARDPNVLSAESEGERLMEAAVQRVQAKLPVVKESLEPAAIRFREQERTKPGEVPVPTPLYREGEFFNRIVGFRTVPNPTDAEREINKYSVDIYKSFGRPSGDRDYDRAYISFVNEFAVNFVNKRISRPDYAEKTDTGKKVAINNAISEARDIAKERTDGLFAEKFPDKFARIQYLRLSRDEKNIVNERYKRDTGQTMEEAKAYSELPKYKDMSDLKFAAGGVVQQMNNLFRK
jgi:hypothetical protein